jgi:transcriptional regulator with XRE-family HTH domain
MANKLRDNSGVESMDKKEIGVTIRKLREVRQWSLRVLAKESGVSLGYLQKIEKGSHKPTVAILEKVAAALDVSVKSLISEHIEENEPVDLEEIILTSDAWKTANGVLYPTDEERRIIRQQLDIALTYVLCNREQSE